MLAARVQAQLYTKKIIGLALLAALAVGGWRLHLVRERNLRAAHLLENATKCSKHLGALPEHYRFESIDREHWLMEHEVPAEFSNGVCVGMDDDTFQVCMQFAP